VSSQTAQTLREGAGQRGRKGTVGGTYTHTADQWRIEKKNILKSRIRFLIRPDGERSHMFHVVKRTRKRWVGGDGYPIGAMVASMIGKWGGVSWGCLVPRKGMCGWPKGRGGGVAGFYRGGGVSVLRDEGRGGVT